MYIIYLIFLILIIISSIAVNSSKNPIHAVCYLILVFLFSSFFLIFIGVDFLAFIFLIIYIGAIAVLFLFVIMLLNIRLIELKSSLISYLPLGFLLILIFLFEFIIIFKNFVIIGDLFFDKYINWIYFIELNFVIIHFIGIYIYNYYLFNFLMSGILLFIATMGSIMIVYKKNEINNRKIQNIYNQFFVLYENNIKLKTGSTNG